MPHHTLLRKPFWNQSESEEGRIKCGALDKVPPTLSLSCPPEGTLRPCLDVGEYERPQSYPTLRAPGKYMYGRKGPSLTVLHPAHAVASSSGLGLSYWQSTCTSSPLAQARPKPDQFSAPIFGIEGTCCGRVFVCFVLKENSPPVV